MNETVIQSILFILSPIIVTMVAIKMLKPLAVKIHLVDHPGGRKNHEGSPPLIGGLAIFVGYAITWAIHLHESPLLLIFTPCAAIIVALGVMDDAKNLSVRTRLLVQVLVALLMCWGTGRYLWNLGDLVGLGEVHLGPFGIILTCLAVVASINAFNMVDGIDGLAGSLSLITLGSLAILLVSSDHTYQFALAVTLAVCILPYLAANLAIKPFKMKIFMGDAGSMLLGFSIVWLLIQTTQSDTPAFKPVTALWIIAIPLMDMVAVMLRRIYRGKSPFSADRGHLHHILQDMGLSQRKTLYAIVAAGVVCAAIGLVGEWAKLPQWVMFSGFISLFLVYSGLLESMLNRKKAEKPALKILVEPKQEENFATVHELQPANHEIFRKTA